MADIQVRLRVPVELNPQNVVIRMQGTQDDLLFHLGDLCRVLRHSNSRVVADRLDDDEKAVRIVYTPGGLQRATFVTESGFYTVILTSRSENARPFKRWITRVVLPSIRKHGCYPPPAVQPRPTLQPYTTRVLEGWQVRNQVPRGHWCVFVESSDLLIAVERVFIPAGLRMDIDDLMDGSVGMCWASHWQRQPWRTTRIQYPYTFPAPSRRGTILAWAYPLHPDLGHFRHWVHEEYLPVFFQRYITRKYGNAGYARALPYIRRVMPAALTA